MCALMFNSSHRPDLLTRSPQLKLAQLRPTLLSTTERTCHKDLEVSHRPMGKLLTCLPRLTLAQLRTLGSTTVGTCHRDLENFPSPDGIFTCLARCLQGGGVFVEGGTVSIVNSQVYSNQAINVRAHVQNFPSPEWDFLADTCPHRLSSWMGTLILDDGCCLDLPVGGTCHLHLKLQKFPWPQCAMGNSRFALCLQGGGVTVFGGTVAISSCTISGNTAGLVRAHPQKFPMPRWESC
jgi:hypothetical protein